MVNLAMTEALIEALLSVERLEIQRKDLEAENAVVAKENSENEIVEKQHEIDAEASQELEPGEVEGTKNVKDLDEMREVADDTQHNNKPSLRSPKIGNPISHSQILELWEKKKALGSFSLTLDDLLRGTQVYVPPPKLKPEPTSEYKRLMSRLRKEEDERSYQRMTNPTPPTETFAQRFPLTSAAHAFASAQQPLKGEDDDEVTYADVDRQIALIFNVLVSIVACASAIWMAAKWWDTPARLALSFSGSLLVGVAEIVVYLGYIRRVGEAKGNEKKLKEVKEIIKTWVIGGPEDDQEDPIFVTKASSEPMELRKRHPSTHKKISAEMRSSTTKDTDDRI